MNAKFDRNVFVAAFGLAIIAIAAAEKVTKAEVQILSRTVLEATHATEDIQYVNQLVNVLSPANKKVAIVFFKHFTGFSYDEKTLAFTHKSKKRYEAAHKESVTFLEDPMNNIWSWADRHIEIAKKDFTLEMVTKQTESFLKKASDKQIAKADVLRAIFKGGFTLDQLLAIMGDMGYEATLTDGEKIVA